MLLQLFLIDVCPNKDKLVLHCINYTLIDFLVGMKFHATRILGIKHFIYLKV